MPSSGFRLTSEVGPLSALTFNRGRTGRRSPFWQGRPARFAAAAFSKQLRHLGVAVRRRASTGAHARGRRARDRVALARRSPTCCG